ncbi:ROK family protein [Prosthecomicrobium pneumaticum]|uniref:N-acetylglucosamine kinase n=1 Tax=Prosthecomicrobium pneumaticum TaxID=81895 RepID=A0A7W9FLP2_9HYPH|nr:ROK family protein [Prosthecomicrobium pneumaticum]MBB5752965.1 N-acetylglucosamine kinase [Prosthecomicrobium pneumaticum]
MRLAFDIGGSKIDFAMVAEDGGIAHRATRPTPREHWDDFVATMRALLEGAPDGPVGLSIAGTTDPRTGMALAANVPVTNGHRLEAELGAALGRTVKAGNDADCFALAEATVGPGRGHAVVFGIILGSGVGGGLVVEGRIVRGTTGVAGEWGHGPILVDAGLARGVPPIRCGCGQYGCVDAYGSARGLEKIFRAQTGRDAPSDAVTAAWHEGEPEATRAVEAQLDFLAGPLAMVVNTVGAGLVPAGGGLAGDARLIAALDARVRAGTLHRFDTPLVVPGATRAASGLIGAAMLVEPVAP